MQQTLVMLFGTGALCNYVHIPGGASKPVDKYFVSLLVLFYRLDAFRRQREVKEVFKTELVINLVQLK